MPGSLLYIGSTAFCGCEKLREVKIPGGVLCVSAYAFKWCSGLRRR